MLLHDEAPFHIYFGDVRTAFDPHEFINIKKNKSLLVTEPFVAMQKVMHLQQLVFLRQVHGTNGLVVNSVEQAANIAPFTCDGDFITTDVPNVGLGIFTADCLPIVFFDKAKPAIGIVHAGWRGSVHSVAVEALKRMEQHYGTKPEDVRVFFGPSAKKCCYQVGDIVLEALEHYPFYEDVLHTLDQKIYFNVPLFNKMLLQEAGVKKEAFHESYNECTMCNDTFCSSRRDKRSPMRQMSIVALK